MGKDLEVETVNTKLSAKSNVQNSIKKEARAKEVNLNRLIGKNKVGTISESHLLTITMSRVGIQRRKPGGRLDILIP